MATETSELPDNIKTIKKYVDKVWKGDDYKSRRDKMNRHLELYEGQLWTEELPDYESKIQINYPFSNVETLCPLLTDNKPMWYVRARQPMFQNMANLYRLGLDFIWDYTDLGDRVIPEAVKWDLITDAGIVETGYNPETREVENLVIDPRTFVCAPGYTDNWKAPWQGTITKTPLSWIAEQFPDKLNDVKHDAHEGGESERSNSDKEFIQLEHERVTVYKIWMKDPKTEKYFKTVEKDDGQGGTVKEETDEVAGRKKSYPKGRIVTFTDTAVLEDKPSPFEHGHPPWVFYYDYKVPGKLWGMGEIEQIEYLHKEFNLQLQAVVKHSRLSHDKNYVYDEDAGLPEDINDTFWEGGNLWSVSMRNTDKPVSSVDPGAVDQAIITLLGMLPQAIEEASQVGDLMKGQSTKRERQSASEISVMIESSYTRVRQKVRNLEGAIKRTGVLNVEIMQQFYKTPRDISFRTSDEDGAGLQYMKIASNKEMLRASNSPVQKADEENPEFQRRMKADQIWQETLRFIEKVGKTDSVYWPFVFEVQTNSTLPMDKQTLANLYLRLAQIAITPDSLVDAEAVLKGLGVPDADAILARKKQEKAEMVKQMQIQQNLKANPNEGRRAGPKPIPMGMETAAQGGPGI
jgi:hypothetical protein